MSEVSSVASSFSSLSSSTSSVAAVRTSSHQEDRPVATSGTYSNDSFVADDAIDESTHLVNDAPDSDLNGGGLDSEQYDSDAFEDDGEAEEAVSPVAVCHQEDEAVDYSDRFEDSDTVVSLVGDVPSSRASIKETPETSESNRCHISERPDPEAHGANALGAHDAGVQHPEDIEELTKEWATGRLHFLTERTIASCSLHARKHSPRAVSSAVEPDGAAVLLQRLRQRAQCSTRIITSPPHHHQPRVPTRLVDRVQVHHLLALSSQSPPPSRIPTRRSDRGRSLSTFCSVKTANLQGKLATQRLSDMCARWETANDSDEALSAATSEFLTAILKEQRQVLRPTDGSVLGALRPHATGMDRAVATATLAVSDTQQLLEHAHRILHAADAHVCSCNSYS